MADNAEDEDWRETLRKAAALVAACDTAPPWLALVMQDALAIAGAAICRRFCAAGFLLSALKHGAESKNFFF